MRMLCYKCGHPWNYKGELSYITCPGCSYKIRADKARVESVESKQELLTILPKKKELPTKILKKLPTTNFERVYFPNGFDCLVHKDIAAQFRELTLKDLQEEKLVVEFVVDQQSKEIKEFDNISDFHLEIQKQDYLNKNKDIPIRIIEIKNDLDLDIRTIPRDPIKLLEHQKNFF